MIDHLNRLIRTAKTTNVIKDGVHFGVRFGSRRFEIALLIGLMARYHPAKDHGNFIRAASLLAEKHPNVNFVLAGNDVDSY